ncbi:MAG TPA: VOC family protein [Anaerolineae bacterium]|nr:VOC family protein [Anaerolineae bacterium]
MMMRLKKLHHVTLIVDDLVATRHFYVDVLGMEEVKRPGLFDFPGQWFRCGGYEVHTVLAEASGQAAGDRENVVRSGVEVTSARHFCFAVEDVAGTLAVLAAAGIELVAGPRDRGDGAIQMYVHDPDGHLVEFVYEP